jgi:UDP-2-acetamido-3-amino-2,3-dideoxy-glucuronate N-acetyltransferase
MIADDVKLGEGVRIYHPQLVNLYGCEIGDGCNIGAFVEIRRTAKLGKNVKVQAFVFIPEGVTIDVYPRSINPDGSLQTGDDWELVPTKVARGASIGANATILCGVTIGAHAMVGCGAVVTKDVPPYAIVAGVPARVVGDTRKIEHGKNQKEKKA